MSVPAVRVRALNDVPTKRDGRWVLYWMTSFRRVRYSFALDRALEHARSLGRPLVILEALRCGYRDASDRLHTFILEGMRDNARRLAASPVLYFPFVEERRGDGAGLVHALAAEACVVVGDDWPCYFVPHMQAAVASSLGARFEVVDSNGLWPMRATDRFFTTARSWRLHLQKNLPAHLDVVPSGSPLRDVDLPTARLPRGMLLRWPRAADELLAASPAALRRLPIRHAVGPGNLRGGAEAAEERLAVFLSRRLAAYPDDRNEPEADGTSGLSPYLHFGHISTHEIFSELARRERWTPSRLPPGAMGGARSGWWRMSAGAEAFLDQLVTWRELAFNAAALRPDDLGTTALLPAFARGSLAKHARDPRPHLYTTQELEHGRTHDRLWNAAQRQLAGEGWFHNSLRMLWGKKILEWSPSVEEALRRMELLMNRYSLDGRDPCSYAGYLWVLGCWDRAWGPERPIFGTVRYMSSDSMKKKLSLDRYMDTYGNTDGRPGQHHRAAPSMWTGGRRSSARAATGATERRK